ASTGCRASVTAVPGKRSRALRRGSTGSLPLRSRGRGPRSARALTPPLKRHLEDTVPRPRRPGAEADRVEIVEVGIDQRLRLHAEPTGALATAAAEHPAIAAACGALHTDRRTWKISHQRRLSSPPASLLPLRKMPAPTRASSAPFERGRCAS